MLVTIFLSSLLCCLWIGQGKAISQDGRLLVQKGVEQYQKGNVQNAIAQWEAALPLYQNNLNDRVVILENLARAYQRVGNIEQAIARWSEVVSTYRRLNNPLQVGRMLTEQAQASIQLGQYQEAIVLLCNAPQEKACTPGSSLQIARTLSDRTGEVAALGSLGEAYRLRGGERDSAAGSGNRQAGEYLEQGLKVAREIQNSQFITALLNSLGNNALNLAQINYRRANSAELIGNGEANELRQGGLTNDQEALKRFQEGITLAQQQRDSTNQLRMLISSIAPAYRTGNSQSALALTQQALALLNQVPDSQEKVYATLDLTRLLQPIPAVQPTTEQSSTARLVQLGGSFGNQCYSATVEPQSLQLLENAVSIAQRISDPRSESFVWGELGRIYECRKDYRQALDRTQKARLTAEQNLRAKDSLYLWEWQTARILKAQGQLPAAIAAYDKALATLKEIRADLLNANRDLQFDFRDAVDPLYRQAVELRLALAGDQKITSTKQNSKATISTQKNLNTVLETINDLRLAELQNYFGNDCIIVPVSRERVSPVAQKERTAIVSSIVLDDRTAIIMQLPDGRQEFHWIDVNRETLRREVIDYRLKLEDDSEIVFEPSQSIKLYNWIIAPFETVLKQSETKTLVFVQDGILRNVPMSALYNSKTQKFLIEEFVVATTPSLSITEVEVFDRNNLRVLALGVSNATEVENQKFIPLEYVTQEIQRIAAKIPQTTTLLNQDFTRDRLQQALKRQTYSILHIATHGQFGTEPSDTFLVTGDSRRLTIGELERFIRNAPSRGQIDLLALTACETAVGDDRSALGLAGVAVQAGARSALASLWSADDVTAAEVAVQFYASLVSNSGISKAEALQSAQIKVLRGQERTHPSYWAPFILIGNWL